MRHKDGPCIVLAGPGSGKTYTIAKRIEHLINHHSVNPGEILVVTFTKYASIEMKQRFLRVADVKSTPVTFGTFHGIYYGILKWAYKLGPQNLLSEEEKYQLLKSIVGNMEVSQDIDDENDFLQGISTEIGNVKNNRLPLVSYEADVCGNEVFREIYRQYEQKRKVMRKIDFDDMLVLCYELFVSRPDILAMWQKKFRYILVDEFQDINQVQYDVVKMLAAPENNLFVVGDDDQSIYRFRGAKPEIILNMKKEFPDAKEILLNINYRSSANIVRGAGKVIRCNKVRYPKEIKTYKEPGNTVHVQEVRNPIEESKYVVEKIQTLLKSGVEPRQIGILFRSNIDVRPLLGTLMEYHLPFYMKEHISNLYEHFIAKNIASYFRLALGGRERSDFLEIMNRPNRYIGRDSVENKTISFEAVKQFYCNMEWMQDRIDQLELDFRVIGRASPFAAIQYIRKRVGYDEFLKEYAAFRKMDFEDLKDVLHEIEERAKEFQTLEEWFVHVEEHKELLEKIAAKQQEKREGIALMTMHGAKGLEFEHVFIIGANEGVTPYKKALEEEEIEEERRMFYVAMTRAKSSLTISYVKERNGKSMDQSRFVGELLKPEQT